MGAVVNRICPCWGNSRIPSPSGPLELMTVDSWCHCCDWQVTRRAAFDAEAAVYSSYVAHYDEHSWRQRRHSVILVWLLTVYDGDDTRGSHTRQNWKDISHLDRVNLIRNNCWCHIFHLNTWPCLCSISMCLNTFQQKKYGRYHYFSSSKQTTA